MADQEERALRQSYGEILSGFSIAKYKGLTIFIRHNSALNNLEADFLYSENYEKVSAKGYPTEQQRLDQLAADGLWTKNDENRIIEARATINDLAVAKKKAFLRKDIDSTNARIKEEEGALEKLLIKRDDLIGATAEKFTHRLSDLQIIRESFYRDSDFRNPVYTQEEFDELEQEELNGLFVLYNNKMSSFLELNIKKIALLPFFQNSLALTDRIYEFYGKPICELTDFQIRLGIYGNYYKNILTSEMVPPDEIASDPEKLEDWFTSKENADKMLEKSPQNEEANVSVIGATKEDLKNWGYDQQDSNLMKATREAGGELSMEQIMKLQGVE